MSKPNPIYKYYAINGHLKNSIRDSYFWFSESQLLNDPFDLCYTLSDNYMRMLMSKSTTDIMRQIQLKCREKGSEVDLTCLEIFCQELLNDEAYIESSREFLAKLIPFSVCCFSEKDDNLLMWSHYSDKHTGVCLIYDLEVNEEFWRILSPVNYSQYFPIANTIEEAAVECLLTKSLGWAYENEWRLLYLGDKGAMPISRNSLKGVIFGCKTDLKEAMEIINLCKASGYEGLSFYQMQKDRQEFKLVKNELTVSFKK